MSLTDLSYYLRKYFPFAILFVGTLMGLVVIIWLVINTSQIQKPIVPPSLTIPSFDTTLGKLDILRLPNNVVMPVGTEYIMDNVEGRPVTATNSANIYFVPPKQTKFGYENRLKSMAKRVGLDTEIDNYTLTTTKAKYQNELINLEIDIATFNFDFNYSFAKKPEIFTKVKLPSESRIQEAGREFLRQMGTYPATLSRGRESLTYLRYDSTLQDFVPVTRVEDAVAVKIDYLKPNIDGFALISLSNTSSQNFVVLTFKDNISFILSSTVRLFEPESNPVGVYPVLTGDEAFARLKEGKASIYRATNFNSTIKIANMYFAYFDDVVYQPYLQPVYIFEGIDRTFIAVVQAVKSDFTALEQ